MALSKTANTILQVVLAGVIVVLSYFLYVSITEPYKVIEEQRELTQLTRQRMANIRTAMIRYERLNGRYPFTLDSLVLFVKQDSLIQARADSVFNLRPSQPFHADSLIYSPRSGSQFELQVNDTSRVKTYLLRDPDSNDHIGTIEPDVTRLNAASWE